VSQTTNDAYRFWLEGQPMTAQMQATLPHGGPLQVLVFVCQKSAERAALEILQAAKPEDTLWCGCMEPAGQKHSAQDRQDAAQWISAPESHGAPAGQGHFTSEPQPAVQENGHQKPALPADRDCRLVLLCPGRQEHAELAQTVLGTLLSEAFVSGVVGISVPFEGLLAGQRAYAQALEAAALAQSGQAPMVAVWEALLLARSVQALPLAVCQSLYAEFGCGRLCRADAQTVRIIQAFLANNLSIAQTAQALYMHRNTLFHRLEKIREDTGLDLRRTDDAAQTAYWLQVRLRVLASGG